MLMSFFNFDSRVNFPRSADEPGRTSDALVTATHDRLVENLTEGARSVRAGCSSALNSAFWCSAAFSAVLGLFFAVPHAAQAERDPWVAPADAAAMANPHAADANAAGRGKTIYAKRCTNCHGETGHADGKDAADLSVEPEKFDGDELVKQTDGALFWKVRTGRKPMPKYSNRLSEDEVWDVVAYIRTLGKK